jgi:hypothetical protein
MLKAIQVVAAVIVGYEYSKDSVCLLSKDAD